MTAVTCSSALPAEGQPAQDSSGFLFVLWFFLVLCGNMNRLPNLCVVSAVSCAFDPIPEALRLDLLYCHTAARRSLTSRGQQCI